MTFIQYNNRKKSRSPFGGLFSLLLIIGLFIGVFWLASKALAMLSAIAPIMLIIAAVLNYSVIIDYGKFVYNRLKSNLVFGIILVLFTIIGFPLVSAFLLYKAWKTRRFGKSEDGTNESVFQEFEEVENEDFLELPDLDAPPKEKSSQNKYDQYFD